MLHLQPLPAPEPDARPYAEAVARLSSVRNALRLVDPFAGGPASDPEVDELVAAAWDEADESRRRAFDARSARLVGATAAGVEALLAEKQAGRDPHEKASQLLVDQIRRELAEVSRLVLG
ncbi:MAG TPA: hypothetical protein VJM15_04095 [Sphingomicrobium sp.]|nr:hypothetical protein [Sphingomicrobium sp.]